MTIRESTVQAEIASWLKETWPDLRFRVEPYGRKPGRGTIKGLGAGWPDVSIYKCRGRFGGLFLEIKRDRKDLFRSDGSMHPLERLDKQAERIMYFRASGYWADFACGTLEAKALIGWYMQLPFATWDDGKSPPPIVNLG